MRLHKLSPDRHGPIGTFACRHQARGYVTLYFSWRYLGTTSEFEPGTLLSEEFEAMDMQIEERFAESERFDLPGAVQELRRKEEVQVLVPNRGLILREEANIGEVSVSLRVVHPIADYE